MARAPHNTETVVREYLEQERMTKAPEQNANDFFEFFCPYVLLRDRSLSEEELTNGVIGNGGDGGIDSVYVFVNDVLIVEDTNLAAVRNAPRVEVEIIQSKLERSFREDTLNRLVAVTDALFALNITADDFEDAYNADVRAAFALFRQTYRSLLRNAPTLSIRYRYVTVRPPNDISAALTRRCDALRNAALERFPDAEVYVELIGAAELWDQIIRRPVEVKTLVTQRSSSGRHGYICLAALNSMNEFLRDEQGHVLQRIFEENVRDWQGFTSVNVSISQELDDGAQREFWWLNNGITILCTDFQNDDNLLSITNPQIVNGLQTCKEITQYFDNLNQDEILQEARSVLVKIIRSDDDDTRDRIIRATNSQNSVSIAMLRATDSFQRIIEEYLLPRELYYERRKNFHANRGRPIRKLVSLTFMTQAVLTFFEFSPDEARARPSDPLKREEDYRALFDPEIPIDAFYKAVKICRDVELYLKDEKDLVAKEINNLRFYVALVAGWMLANQPDLNAQTTSEIDLHGADNALYERAFNFVYAAYRRVGGDDDAVKSPKLKNALLRKAQRVGLGP